MWGCPYPSNPTPWTWTRDELKVISVVCLAGTTSTGSGQWCQRMTPTFQIEKDGVLHVIQPVEEKGVLEGNVSNVGRKNKAAFKAIFIVFKLEE